MSFYFMNLILVTMLSVSVAGSIIYIFAKLLAGVLCERYEGYGLYALMRAAVLFFLFPAGAFVAVTFYVWIRPQWGILEPKGVLDVITCDHSSGIFMIWNRELNLARFLAFVVWMGGFLVFFLFRLVREQLIMKKIRAASAEWKDERVLAISAVFRRGLGIRRDIGIYKCGFIASPFSAGILHTDIFFPSDTRCGEEFFRKLLVSGIFCKHRNSHFLHNSNCILCFLRNATVSRVNNL